MSRAWRVLGILMVAGSALGAQEAKQGVVHLSPREKLVTVAIWRRACGIGTLSARAETARADVAKAQQDSVEAARAGVAADLQEAQGTLEEAHRNLEKAKQDLDLAMGPPTAGSDGLVWLCQLKDPRNLPQPVPALPSREAVINAASRLDSLINRGDLALGALSPAGSIFGVSESAIISGLTTLILDRAAAEIRIAFLDRIDKEICTPADIKRLFTTTCTVFRQEHLRLRKSVVRELHTALRTDLRELPHSGPLAAANNAKFLNDSMPAPEQDAILAAYVVGTSAAAVLGGKDPLSAITSTLGEDPDVLGGLDGLGLLEAALARADSTRKSLRAAAVLQRVALVGLMLPGSDGSTSGKWPTEGEERLHAAKALAVNLGGWLVELGVVQESQLGRVLNEAVSLGNSIVQTQAAVVALNEKLKTIGKKEGDLFPEYAKLIDDALALTEQWAQIADRYRSSPSEARLGPVIGALRHVSAAFASRDYAAAAVAIYVAADSLQLWNVRIPPRLKPVFSATTALAQAKDGHEVAAVLEAYAAPVQSYRGKREDSTAYVAINAYLGASGGREWANDEPGEFMGVSAPVGIEVGKSLAGRWSLSLFAQILDLGALASYRLNAEDDQLASEPEVGFAQVFSPGGYLVLGFPRVPVALGFGANLAPSLRKISANEEVTRNATRLGAFLSIDLTLFRLK